MSKENEVNLECKITEIVAQRLGNLQKLKDSLAHALLFETAKSGALAYTDTTDMGLTTPLSSDEI